MGRPRKIQEEDIAFAKAEKKETKQLDKADKKGGYFASSALDAIDEIESSFEDTASAFKPKKTKVEIIPTGSPSIDDIAMIGGYPRGRIVHIFGPFGGGKTFTTMIAAKNALAMDPENHVIWIDAENTFEYSWAEKLGIWDPNLYDETTGKDRNRLRVIPVNNGVSIFERLSGKIRESKKGSIKIAKKVVPGYIDHIIEGRLKCPLIVLDSLAAIIPPGEDISPVGKANIALLSRFLPVEFRRLATPLFKSGACLICINQVTTQIGDMWGDEFGFSGGEKLKHWISLNLFIDRVNARETKILTEKDNVESIIGQTIKVVVKKNKFGPYPRSCKSKLLMTAGTEHTGKKYEQIGFVDTEEEWIELGINYGIIEQGGSWVSYKEDRAQGKAKFADMLRANKDVLNKIIADIMVQKRSGAINNMHIDEEKDVLDQFDNKSADFEDDETGE